MAAVALAAGPGWSLALPPIKRIIIQTAKGRRLTPVAPNAYAPYRGYDVNESIVRIQTSSGLEGIGRAPAKPEVLKSLLGLHAPSLFRQKGAYITGAAERYQDTAFQLFGANVALLDLIGKYYKCPIADLLGKRLHQSVRVYDSSLYMEDLLKPASWMGLPI